MVKVTMNVNGMNTDYEISNMETLAKFQAMLTEEVVKSIQPEISEEQRQDIIHDYLQECDDDYGMRCDLVEEITNNLYNVCTDIEEHLLRDTDFDRVEEMQDAIECKQNALYEIYNIAREYA